MAMRNWRRDRGYQSLRQPYYQPRDITWPNDLEHLRQQVNGTGKEASFEDSQENSHSEQPREVGL